MRSLNEYITLNESGAVNERSVNYTKPRSVKVLQKIIKQRIIEQGPNCDLNDIDVSGMKSMSHLFCGDTNGVDKVLNSFNGDISQWDVSNVKDMFALFSSSKFNGDISKWDVSNVERMGAMFEMSVFNRDISKWDVSNVEDMEGMFMGSKFTGDLSKWNVSNVMYMIRMFYKSPLDGKEPSWYEA